jgi:hypothetical protein
MTLADVHSSGALNFTAKISDLAAPKSQVLGQQLPLETLNECAEPVLISSSSPPDLVSVVTSDPTDPQPSTALPTQGRETSSHTGRDTLILPSLSQLLLSQPARPAQLKVIAPQFSFAGVYLEAYFNPYIGSINFVPRSLHTQQSKN